MSLRSTSPLVFAVSVSLAASACYDESTPLPCVLSCEDTCPADMVCGADGLCREASGVDCSMRPMELADISDVVPYVENDFEDNVEGVTSFLDNRPNAIASIHAPLPAGFAIAAGRSVIELPLDGAPVVHDFRPSAPNGVGPDQIVDLGMVDDELWMSSWSPGQGDGLYRIDPGWGFSADNELNNVTAFTQDSGAFEAQPGPTVYYVHAREIRRRESMTAHALIRMTSGDITDLAVTPSSAFVVIKVDADNDSLHRVAGTTHVQAEIATARVIELAESRPTSNTVTAIRDERQIVTYAENGGLTLIAEATDPDVRWVGATIPRAPHPLENRIVILELDRTRDRVRVLVLPP